MNPSSLYVKLDSMRKRFTVIVAAVLILSGAAFAVWTLLVKGNAPTEVMASRIEFKPENFVHPLERTNEYQPLKPGMQFTRAGSTEVGSRKVPHQVVSTVTDVVRIIDGVPAIAVLDQSEDSGEIAQVGFDYLAIDKDGNIWILGGYTEDFQGGQYTNVNNAFLGKSTGAEVGILIPAVVNKDTPRWFIGSSGPKEDPSVAEPVAVGQDIKVAFGEYHNVRAVREGGSKAVDNEIKYYAPGVGVVLNVPKQKSLHQDDFQLINLIQLSPEGLAEASKIVLDLEEHAKTVAPEVYAKAPKAERLAVTATPIIK